MIDPSPLALCLRQVRHGRRALVNGYPWAARIHLRVAKTWLLRGYERLDRRRAGHYAARVLFTQRILDSFAVGIALAERRELPVAWTGKSEPAAKPGGKL